MHCYWEICLKYSWTLIMVMILLDKRCSVQCNKLVVKELCIGGSVMKWRSTSFIIIGYCVMKHVVPLLSLILLLLLLLLLLFHIGKNKITIPQQLVRAAASFYEVLVPATPPSTSSLIIPNRWKINITKPQQLVRYRATSFLASNFHNC